VIAMTLPLLLPGANMSLVKFNESERSLARDCDSSGGSNSTQAFNMWQKTQLLRHCKLRIQTHILESKLPLP